MLSHRFADLVSRYIAGAKQPAEAIAGLADAELDAHPVPGTWSIREIVLHLMDSDLIASDRMKRVIAENRPPMLIGYDETAFAGRLYGKHLDVAKACEIFRLNREMTGEILTRLADDAFARTGEHNESGTVTLEYLVETYVKHVAHHLRFVREKRRLVGKPLE
ncbi:MAG: DinB family protein [Pirellulales bacterium]|nr:DinB family protein [Pirellulales bacterium]